jgi:hypothetical protein
MTNFSRLLTLAVAAASLAVLSPVVAAQNNQQQNRQQQQRSQQEQRDLQALVQLVDAVSAGKQPAPSDIPVAWYSQHFIKGPDGATYIPFTLTLDGSGLKQPAAAMYIRVVNKEPAPAPAPAQQNNNNRNRNEQQRVIYPWDQVQFLNIPASNKVSRGIQLKPGQYEVFIAVKEATVGEPPRNAPPAKVGLLRRDLTVPDFNGPDMATSDIIIASAIEPLSAPMTREQQQENPYTLGALQIVPAPGGRLKKSGELGIMFWIYGIQHQNGKPNVVIEYNFHQKVGAEEKYFNKTTPQELNAQTIAPQFDLTMGHQLTSIQQLPLGSFPVGDFRLEIKITDKISGKTLTKNLNFTVEA